MQRPLGPVVEAIAAIWSTNAELRHHATIKYQLLLKIVVQHLISAIGLADGARHSLYELRIFLGFLIDVINVSSSVKYVVQQTESHQAIISAQLRFSDYTSGWNLCKELDRELAAPTTTGLEMECGIVMATGIGPSRLSPDQRTRTSSDRDETYSVSSTRTATTLASIPASSLASDATLIRERASRKQETLPVLHEHVQMQRDTAEAAGKFRLQTLEEHRFATRFLPKQVTAKTWRHAQRDAYQLLQSGDRNKLAEALYILLEIAWLSPRGAPLARNYLNIGSIYMTFDHLDEAAKAYRHCLRLDPGRWKARYNLGVALARLEEFIDSTKQLRLVLSSGCCDDPEMQERVRLMLHEVEELQLARNRLAFKQTAKARTFTLQFLNTLRAVSSPSESLDASRAPPDLLLRPGYRQFVPKTLPPVLYTHSKGWQSSIASLLHRLFVLAWCRGISVENALRVKDPATTVGVSLAELDDVTREITGVGLSPAEYQALFALFGSRSIAFHFLDPRPETLVTISKLQHGGIYRAALDWRLSLRCADWSSNAACCTTGFRNWLAMPMPHWVSEVLTRSAAKTSSTADVAIAVTQSLRSLGWFTPVDFGLFRRPLPLPDELFALSFAVRGAVIFEAHRARTSVQHEACIVIQMMARRQTLLRRAQARRLLTHKKQQNGRLEAIPGYPRPGVRLDDKLERELLRQVRVTVEDLVDAIVEHGFKDLESLDSTLSASAISPTRTEFRLRRSLPE